ncbi:MAG: hypothetical protein ABIK89_09025 [Planctomycetota bacterium]
MQAADTESAGGHALLAPGRFVQIPGPNPILVPGGSGAWDDGVVEAADALKDNGVYYLFYHATGAGKGYRLGVATASGPLGPFRKHGREPLLDLGRPGSWDDRHVACAMIIKEGPDRYLMWYSGLGAAGEYSKWSIGLATASNLLGPWKKHEGNPILPDFGYVGGVVKVDGKYYLYTAYPIGSIAPDYSPMALATADRPEGPWTRWPKNPVLKEGKKGQWDDGGFSEAEVLHWGGAFHMFYGGAKVRPVRILTRESIGYAYSLDGYNFQKFAGNPVASREANPNAAAFAEVHAIVELPFIYLYHTLRYKEPLTPAHKKRFPAVEDLGVQILVTSKPFQLEMPVLAGKTLGPNATTSLAESPPICLGNVTRVTLTAQCGYAPKASKPIRIRVRSSDDGIRYDSKAVGGFDVDLKPGEPSRKVFNLETKEPFIKILAENPDRAESVSSLRIAVKLGG